MFTQDFYEIPSTVRVSNVTNSECNEHVEPYEGKAEEQDSGSCCCSSNCICEPSTSCSCEQLQHVLGGKDGAEYMRHGGFCLNPQQYPDAMNNVKLCIFVLFHFIVF